MFHNILMCHKSAHTTFPFRYLNAVHLLGYIGLSGGSVYGNSILKEMNDKHKLLNEQEVRGMAVGKCKLHWSAEAVL